MKKECLFPINYSLPTLPIFSKVVGNQLTFSQNSSEVLQMGGTGLGWMELPKYKEKFNFPSETLFGQTLQKYKDEVDTTWT